MNAAARFGPAALFVIALAVGAAPKEEVSPAHAACETCGVIRSIREIRVEGPAPRTGAPTDLRASMAYVTGPGAPLLVGPMVSGSFGPGGPSQAYVGALGSDRMIAAMQETRYEVIVRMSDGSFIRVEEADASDLKAGDRVKIIEGRIGLPNQ
jgi:hypothetical protein